MNTTPNDENKPVEKCNDCGRLQHEGENSTHSGRCNTTEALEQRQRDLDAAAPKIQMVNAAGDERTVNNVMRHEYRVLSDREKEAMKAIKDCGLAFLETLTEISEDPAIPTTPNGRAFSLARTKIEEAVMWAVKGLTG